MDSELRALRLQRHFGEKPDPRHDEFIPGRGDDDARLASQERFEFGRDYDRLLYSSAFRKLGGVTQVVSASRELGDFHNRMTHSLKVAQTGVRLASWLKAQDRDVEAPWIAKYGGLHPSVVRAACLAHDFGHPPFGHIGEYAIRDICENPSRFIPAFDGGPLTDSFEGNAQTFRIVTRLSFREAPVDNKGEPALNLTRATLAAICKYPWTRDDQNARIKQGKKWGAYATEAVLLKDTLEGLTETRTTKLYGKPHTETRTIEAQLMDLADDIAYAVHDIEDFFRAGLIPLHEIAKHDKEFKEFTDAAHNNLLRTDSLPCAYDPATHRFKRNLSVEEIRQILKTFVVGGAPGVFASVPHSAYDGSLAHRRSVHTFASGLIGKTTSGIRVTKKGVVEYQDPNTHVVIEVLKQLTDYYVLQGARLASAQIGQRTIVIDLVRTLYEWVAKFVADGGESPKRMQVPQRLNDYYTINLQLNAALPEHERVASAGVILRTVVDYVASMTDEQARAWHDRVCLGRTGSMLEPQLFI